MRFLAFPSKLSYGDYRFYTVGGWEDGRAYGEKENWPHMLWLRK